MNDPPIPINRLREAMRNANIEELNIEADKVGQEAVQSALAMVEHAPKFVEAEAERQRDLDAAHGDAIEVVRRAQVRNGRRVFSAHDGKTVRQVYELLRSIMGPDGGSDSDPSFQ